MKKVELKSDKYLEQLTALAVEVDTVPKEDTDRIVEFSDEFKIIQDTIVKKGFEDAFKELKHRCKILSDEEKSQLKGFKPYPFSACVINPISTFEFKHLITVEGDLYWQKIIVAFEENGVLKSKRKFSARTFSSEILRKYIIEYFDTISICFNRSNLKNSIYYHPFRTKKK